MDGFSEEGESSATRRADRATDGSLASGAEYAERGWMPHDNGLRATSLLLLRAQGRFFALDKDVLREKERNWSRPRVPRG